MTLFEGVMSQFWKIVGLVAFVAASLTGQSHLVGEPWEHVLSVAGTIAGVLLAWNIKQHPVKDNAL